MKRFLLLLLILLLHMNLFGFIIGEDKVAILVDQLLYDEPDFVSSLNTYINAVESTFSRVFIVSVEHELYQKMDPVGDMANNSIRKIIYDLWINENIQGVILVGDVPLPVYQSFGLSDNVPLYYPVTLPYEDLDGAFYNDYSVGADGLRATGPGNDHFLDSWEPISRTNRPDIWVSLMRPRELVYQTSGIVYSEEAENAEINGNAFIHNNPLYSGGQAVAAIGNGPLNDLVFDDIDVPADGLYLCTIYYYSDWRVWGGMYEANGKQGSTMEYYKVNPDSVVSQNISLYLSGTGMNTLRIFMDVKDCTLPYIDRIEISPITGYDSSVKDEMIRYLDKCTSYFNGQMVTPQRALVYSAEEYAAYPAGVGESGTISASLTDTYGEENLVFGGNCFSTGQDYLNKLSNGYKLNHIRSHSGAGESYIGGLGPRPTLRAVKGLDNNIGRGAHLSVLWNCVAANYLAAPLGSMASQYMHGGNGMSAVGVTRSTLTYFLFDVFGENIDGNPAQSDNMLGYTHLKSKEWYYCDSGAAVEFDGRDDFPLMSQVLLGNPFVLALDDFSALPSSVSGKVIWADGIPIPSADVRIYRITARGEMVYGHYESDESGQYLFDWLPSGTYRVSVELKNGMEASSSDFNLAVTEDLVLSDFIFAEKHDLITTNDLWEYSLNYFNYPDAQGDSWYEDEYDTSSWFQGKAPFNRRTAEHDDGTSLDGPGYSSIIYIRKSFMINDPVNFQLHISCDEPLELYINGFEVTENPFPMVFGNQARESADYWNLKLDYADLENYINSGKNLMAVKMQGIALIDVTAYDLLLTPQPEYQNLDNGDVNGDLIEDGIRLKHNNGYTFIQVKDDAASQNNYETQFCLESSFIEEASWLIGDVNGDGTDDLIKIIPFNGNAYFEVYISTGTSFIKEEWSSASCGITESTFWELCDLNQDGKADLVKYDSPTSEELQDIYLAGENVFYGYGIQNYEAESSDNIRYGSAHVVINWKFSREKGVGGIKASQGGYMEFPNIYAPTPALYTLRIHYFHDWYDFPGIVTVNNSDIYNIMMPGVPGGLTFIDVDIALEDGANEIRFEGNPDMPNIDRIEIINPRDVYEAESLLNDLSSSAGIYQDISYSGRAKVINLGMGVDNYIQFNGIMVDTDDMYRVKITYDNSPGLDAWMSVDNKEAYRLVFQKTDILSSVYCDLNLSPNAAHTFRIYSLAENLPDFDCLEIAPDNNGKIYYSSELWRDEVGVVSTINSLEKTGTVLDWDCGAASAMVFRGDGGIEFSPVRDDKYLMAGLSLENEDNSFQTVDYAIILTTLKRVGIYENGLYHPIGDVVYHPGDTFRIERIGSEIVYTVNTYELYRSTVPCLPDVRLLFDVCFYNPGAAIENCHWIGGEDMVSGNNINLRHDLASIELIDRENVEIGDGSIKKTGINDAWDSGAASVTAFTGDGGISFEPGQLDKSVICGLSVLNTDTNYYSIDYAIILNFVRRVGIYEKGVQIPIGDIVYHMGDTLTIQRQGNDIVYYIRDYELHRSVDVVDPETELLFDASLFHPDSEILNIKWIDCDLLVSRQSSPLWDEFSEITWIDQVGVTASTTSVEKTASTTAWDSGAFSVASFTGNGGIEFSPARDDKFLIAGLADENIDNNYNTIDYAIILTAQKRIGIYENGYHPSIGDIVYHIGDTLRIERVRNEIIYSVNQYELYRSSTYIDPRVKLGFDVSFYNPGGKIDSFKWIDNDKVLFTKPVDGDIFNNNMTSSDDPTTTVSYAGSVDSFVLDGGVEFIAGEAGVTLVCGLHKRLTYSEITEVEFGIKLNADSTLSIMELGVETPLSSSVYQAGDVFQVVREGIDMVYYQNQDEIYRGTARVDAMDSLMVHARIYTLNTSVLDVEWITRE